MASAQVVETSVTNNSPSQDSNHPDDLFQSRFTQCHTNYPQIQVARQIREGSSMETKSTTAMTKRYLKKHPIKEFTKQDTISFSKLKKEGKKKTK